MNPVLIQLTTNFSTFRTLNSEIGQKFKNIIWTYLLFLARSFAPNARLLVLVIPEVSVPNSPLFCAEFRVSTRRNLSAERRRTGVHRVRADKFDNAVITRNNRKKCQKRKDLCPNHPNFSQIFFIFLHFSSKIRTFYAKQTQS